MRITKYNINEFIYGSMMNCDNMGVTHIDYIPEGITHLYCGSNKLTSLNKLPESLTHLDCGNNELTKLPNLPESLTELYCYDNNLPYQITLKNFKEHNKLIKRKEILKRICV